MGEPRDEEFEGKGFFVKRSLIVSDPANLADGETSEYSTDFEIGDYFMREEEREEEIIMRVRRGGGGIEEGRVEKKGQKKRMNSLIDFLRLRSGQPQQKEGVGRQEFKPIPSLNLPPFEDESSLTQTPSVPFFSVQDNNDLLSFGEEDEDAFDEVMERESIDLVEGELSTQLATTLQQRKAFEITDTGKRLSDALNHGVPFTPPPPSPSSPPPLEINESTIISQGKLSKKEKKRKEKLKKGEKKEEKKDFGQGGEEGKKGEEEGVGIFWYREESLGVGETADRSFFSPERLLSSSPSSPSSPHSSPFSTPASSPEEKDKSPIEKKSPSPTPSTSPTPSPSSPSSFKPSQIPSTKPNRFYLSRRISKRVSRSSNPSSPPSSPSFSFSSSSSTTTSSSSSSSSSSSEVKVLAASDSEETTGGRGGGGGGGGRFWGRKVKSSSSSDLSALQTDARVLASEWLHFALDHPEDETYLVLSICRELLDPKHFLGSHVKRSLKEWRVIVLSDASPDHKLKSFQKILEALSVVTLDTYPSLSTHPHSSYYIALSLQSTLLPLTYPHLISLYHQQNTQGDAEFSSSAHILLCLGRERERERREREKRERGEQEKEEGKGEGEKKGDWEGEEEGGEGGMLEMMLVAPKFRIAAREGERRPFGRAVKELGRLTGEILPSRKMQIIQSTYREICSAVADYYKNSKKQVLLGADDLLPIFSYCLVHSRLSCALSEFGYMNDFILDEDINGEMGYVLATLHTALQIVTQLGIEEEEKEKEKEKKRKEKGEGKKEQKEEEKEEKEEEKEEEN